MRITVKIEEDVGEDMMMFFDRVRAKTNASTASDQCMARYFFTILTQSGTFPTRMPSRFVTAQQLIHKHRILNFRAYVY